MATKGIQWRKRLKDVARHYEIYLIILPAVAYYILFHYIPMYSITMAFKDYKFNLGMFRSPWVGFQYFEAFFNYYNFWVLIRNTLLISFFKLVVYFPIPILFALMLNEIRSGWFKKVVQTASYLPHFISWVIAVVMLQQFLSLDGIVNQIREGLGLQKIFFMNEQQYFYPIMFLSYVWKSFGMGSVIYIAALAGVDVSLYEAARTDGAGKLRQIWHISLPSIMPTAVMLFILSLSSVLSAGWDQIYLLRSPGNMQLADILDTYIIQEGLRNAQYGYATAVSLFQSVIGLLLVYATNKLSSRVSEISLF